MCKFIGKSNERILCKLSRSEILRLYSIVHVAMETTKTSNFTCQSKSFISLLFTCQVLACELQPFSWHDLANDIYSQTAKTVFSHLYLNIVRKWKTVAENSKKIRVIENGLAVHFVESFSRQLCKPSTSPRVCITVSNSRNPSCLYQAMQTRKTFSIA